MTSILHMSLSFNSHMVVLYENTSCVVTVTESMQAENLHKRNTNDVDMIQKGVIPSRRKTPDSQEKARNSQELGTERGVTSVAWMWFG